jgi:hypothetical protein
MAQVGAARFTASGVVAQHFSIATAVREKLGYVTPRHQCRVMSWRDNTCE